VPLLAVSLFGSGPLLTRRLLPGTLGLALLFAALGLSLSRGAALGALAALLTLGLIRLATAPWSLRVLAVAVGLLALLIVAQPVAQRLTTLDEPVQVMPGNFAEQERRAHWGAALRMLREQPVTGVGAGQFNLRYRELTPAWRFRIPRGHAHNAYLQVAAETGLAGLVGYLALLATVGWSIARRWRAGSASRPVLAAAAAVTAVWLAHGLVEYLHVLNLGLIIVAWWALAMPATQESHRVT
jgi:O-antigen ligase